VRQRNDTESRAGFAPGSAANFLVVAVNGFKNQLEKQRNNQADFFSDEQSARSIRCWLEEFWTGRVE